MIRVFSIVILGCLFFFSITSGAQNTLADSISVLEKKRSNDTLLVKLYNQAGELVYSFLPDSAIRCWERSAALCEKKLAENPGAAEKKIYLTESSAALNNIGFVYQNSGEALLAIKYLKKSMLISMMINDHANVAIALNNIGHNLANIGNNVGALDYYNQNLEVVIKHGTKKEIINSLVVLGDMYAILGDEASALQYMNKALAAAAEIKDTEATGYIHTLIGNVYFKFDEYQKALTHDSISLALYKSISKPYGICTAYNNIGARYYAMANYEKALENFNQSLLLRKELKDIKGMHATLINMGTTLIFLNRQKEGYKRLNESYELAKEGNDKMLEWTSLKQMGNSYFVHQKDYRMAAEYGIKSLELARQLGFPEMIRFSAKLLSDTYTQTGDYKKAFEMQKLYMAMRDSLVNVQTRKASLNSQLKYEYEIKAAADSVRTAADKQLTQALLNQEKTKGYALYGGLMLTALFGGFMFNRYKKTKRQKLIIEQKERETNYQKGLIENKNKEILDSISYAKRLQDAILPPSNMFREALNESFILYKPKDIVAGDFYWMERSERDNQLIYFAVADCTGHGVPGAMVSVVCSNALSRTVKEFRITEPGKILDKVRELVIETFEKSESEVKDGMDISLCSLNPDTLELKWAGANSPLWVSKKSDHFITEIKGDKQPVGAYFNLLPFCTHTVKLERGDCVYLFTDGFADQFGGEKGKKFKSSKMKELFLSVKSQTMNQQADLITESFEGWRSNFEQVDDVCVIGIRV